MNDLPTLQPTPPDYAERYARDVFGDRLIAVTIQPHNAFRALFSPGYFTIQPGKDAPSKSQWSTLKKRMKRVHGGVFVFKEHGTTTHAGESVFYVDFGFFAD